MQDHEVANGQSMHALGIHLDIPLLLACHATPQVSGWLHVDIQLVDTVLTLLSSVQREQQTTLSTACGNVSSITRDDQVGAIHRLLGLMSRNFRKTTVMQDHEVAGGQSKHALGNHLCIPLLLACHATPQVSGWSHISIQFVDTVLTLLSSVQ